MKKINTILLLIVASLGALTILILTIAVVPFVVWTLVEFILYLVKDRPFNWLSLWLTIAVIVGRYIVGLIGAALKAMQELRDEQKEDERFRKRLFGPTGKSKFQQRLDEMAKERGVKLPDNK